MRVRLSFRPLLRALWIFAAALWGIHATAAADPVRVPHGTVELIPETSSVQPGSSFTLGLHFRLEPGWHIYWKNPGDSGLPPRVRWEVPEGVTAGAIQWPTPKRLPVGSLLDYGYEGDVLLPIPFEAAPPLKAGSMEVGAHLRVLVCRETCMPGKADLSLRMPVRVVKPATLAQNEPLFAAARASMPIAKPASLQTSAKETGNTIVLTLKGLNRNASAEFFPDKNGEIQNAAPQAAEATADGLKLKLVKAAAAQASISTLEGLVVVREGQATRAYGINASLASAPAQAPASGSGPTVFVMLGLAFLGGIVLNLMPCVFPVLSIKALHLMEGAGRQYRTVRLGAVAYTAGVVVSFWILVAVLLGLRAGGAHLGWGFQLQSPGFVAFLCCLLFLFGLSLAGLFEIGGSMMSVGSGLAQRTGYAGSFFTGVLAVIVATPCTAPFMGAAVGFALSQAAWICTLVFTAMALGLAAPFLLLAFVPQLSRWVPRPGRWMETLKQFFAFPIFATVVWLLWVLGQQVEIDQLATVLLCLLGIAMGGWLLGRWNNSRIASAAAFVIVLAAAAYPVATLPASASTTRASSARTSGDLNWQPFSSEKVAEYRSQQKPVLIDFTAAWCVTCQVNDRVVFHSSEVVRGLKDARVELLRADWTSYDPNITQALAEFGRSAVPLYVLYLPDQDRPVVFPDGLLRPSSVLNELQKIKT